MLVSSNLNGLVKETKKFLLTDIYLWTKVEVVSKYEFNLGQMHLKVF